MKADRTASRCAQTRRRPPAPARHVRSATSRRGRRLAGPWPVGSGHRVRRVVPWVGPNGLPPSGRRSTACAAFKRKCEQSGERAGHHGRPARPRCSRSWGGSRVPHRLSTRCRSAVCSHHNPSDHDSLSPSIVRRRPPWATLRLARVSAGFSARGGSARSKYCRRNSVRIATRQLLRPLCRQGFPAACCACYRHHWSLGRRTW